MNCERCNESSQAWNVIFYETYGAWINGDTAALCAKCLSEISAEMEQEAK